MSHPRIVICLLLLIHAGCQKAPEQNVFHGDLFTYAAESDPENSDSPGWTGPIPSAHPRSVFRSDVFWQLHAEQNPSISAEDMVKLRKRFSIKHAESITFHDRLVSKWAVHIWEGDQSAFESLCSTYQKVQAASPPEREFLEQRREALLESYSDTKSAHEKNPSLESEAKVEIARRNFNQIDERLDAMRRGNGAHGQIVWRLMAFEEADELGIN